MQVCMLINMFCKVSSPKQTFFKAKRTKMSVLTENGHVKKTTKPIDPGDQAHYYVAENDRKKFITSAEILFYLCLTEKLDGLTDKGKSICFLCFPRGKKSSITNHNIWLNQFISQGQNYLHANHQICVALKEFFIS